MAINDPQIHIDAALEHIKPVKKSGGGEYPSDPAQCQRAQAEAQIAQAMCLSGIGAQLVELNAILRDAMNDTKQSKSSKF